VNTVLIVAGLSVVAIAVVWLLASQWARTSARGGQDKEARKRLEEMARRDKEARKVKSRPLSLTLRSQLERLRARLRRHRM
jgi:hypothetical protein